MNGIPRRALYGALIVLSLCLVLTGCFDAGTGSTQDTTAAAGSTASEAKESRPVVFAVSSISKHGNVVLDAAFDEMKSHNMEVGDIITVSAGGREYDLPVGTAYTDVDSGEMVCRFDAADNEIALVVNMGSFAKETGIGTKREIAEEPGYKWEIAVREVSLVLKEKQGYRDEYDARNLTRTDARGDYAALTDEQFANFRAVAVTGMKENVLYRSSTPIDPSLGRSEYAMAATEAAGIRSIINLNDSAEAMKSFDAYPGSYYSRCNLINPEMNYDFGTEEFAAKVKECAEFLIENDGPYLIHCKEGKDRTGILCAILECYIGASVREVEDDYMATFCNYYGVSAEDAVCGIILNNNLVKTLSALYQVDDIAAADLRGEAEEYLLSIGLTQAELAALSAKLGA